MPLSSIQPVLSASLLDEFLCEGHTYAPPGANDAETFVQITSLQQAAFLLNTCDHLLVVNDWLLDLHLLKLLCTARMLLGESASQAELIFLFPAQARPTDDHLAQQLQSVLGDCTVVYECGPDRPEQLLHELFRICAKRKALSAEQPSARSSTSEVQWLANAQRFWESCVRKSSIFVDYARFLPKINFSF